MGRAGKQGKKEKVRSKIVNTTQQQCPHMASRLQRFQRMSQDEREKIERLT